MSSPMSRNRELVAQTAARIIVEEGLEDYRLAKLKAAERLGLSERSDLPRNTLVEEAIHAYQNLFDTAERRARLHQLRQAALRTMQLLADFQPRLVGTVLKGTATDHSLVNLHVFADTVEDVIFLLMDRQIPYQSAERRLRDASGYRQWPTLLFMFAQADIEAIVFSPNSLRRPPLSPVDGRPMRRAKPSEVEALLNAA